MLSFTLNSTVNIGFINKRFLISTQDAGVVKSFSNKHGRLFNDSKSFSSISKLCLIFFALRRSGIALSKQPLLSFKTIYHSSEDFQAAEIKGKL